MARVSIMGFLILVQGALLFNIFHERHFMIAFLDVGQGDSIYIQAPNGNDMLIDGGPSEGVLRELSKVTDVSNRDLDVVIATHPDKDHIGGLVSVFDRYEVSYFLDPGVENDTQVHKELQKRVAAEAEYVLARKGMKIHLGKDAVVDVLYPDREIRGDTNNASVVVRVSYKETDILLTGDAGRGVERYLLGENIESEILKAGHHGSKTSSDPLFLEKVLPLYTIVSAGAGNRYGHPHANVLSALADIETKTLATYEQGSIVFISDGERFWRKAR